MIRRLFSLAMLMLLLASCTNAIDNVENLLQRAGADSKLPVFYATIEGSDAATKVYADDQLRVLWNKNDSISLFNKTTGNQKYRFQGEDGDNAGTFIYKSGDASETSLEHTYALYPYSAGAAIDENGVISLTLPSLQTYKEKSFGPDANTMLSVTDNDKLMFRNVCAYLCIKLYGDNVSVKSLSIKGNWGNIITGPAKLTLSEDCTPSIEVEPWAGRLITLLCESPVKIGTTKDDYTEFWIVIPPICFNGGFTVTVNDDQGRIFKKSTDNALELERNTIYHMSPIEVVPVESDYALERQVLIDFYNAMDGPNWKDNTNWCSELPVSEWAGVYSAPDGDGHVEALFFDNNNMKGTVPASLANLKHLGSFRLIENANPIDFSGVCEIASLGELYFSAPGFTIPENIGKLKNLASLYAYGPSGTIPESFFELESLDFCVFTSADLGPLPTGFSKLKNLRFLQIYGSNDNAMAGPIPEDLYDCTKLEQLLIAYTGINGEISPKIKNLTNLWDLRLYGNQLSGNLPVEMTELKIIKNLEEKGWGDQGLWLVSNNFSGKVPAEFRDWPEWILFWGYVVNGNNLDISDCMPRVPEFTVNTLSGTQYSSSSVYNKELTVFVQWDTGCDFFPPLIPELKALYTKYHEKGLDIVSWSYESEETMIPFVEANGFPWICFSNEGHGGNSLGIQMWPNNTFPSVVVYDGNGEMVYYSFGLPDGLTELVDSRFGLPLYESTDYSADGTVHTLQLASAGNGIDVVLMGDAYSDRLIANGTYQSAMNQAYNAFFSEEPYMSCRHLFNVYYVDVVSKNEEYYGTTALSTWYGEGTAVGGDGEKVFQYTQKALSDSQIDDALIIVMMNRDYYAGTCYMYYPDSGDYGRGPAVAYFPTSSDTDTFNGLVSHEAGGHGFAKLADEYAYEYMGAIPANEMANRKAMEPYGWWKNVDFTGDPAQVKWNRFIADARYDSQGLGCYEGGLTYWSGVWRPTENSIMRYNTGGFNAPSREAIWYRIHKLAYGANWQYNYEDFVTYDAVNRTAAASYQAPRPDYVTRQLPPPTPPVVIGHGWREAVGEK